jgi:hypothetical protein
VVYLLLTGFQAKTAFLVSQLNRFYVAPRGPESEMAAIKVCEVE